MPPQRIPRHRTSHGTTRPTESLPSRGGTRGYSQDTRRIAIQNEVNGLNQSVEVNQLRFNGLYPSDRTVRRWNARVVTEGNYLPYEMNGNNPATTLQGHMLIMLVLFRMCFPKATAAEVNAFLFSCTLPGQHYRFFSESHNAACFRTS